MLGFVNLLCLVDVNCVQATKSPFYLHVGQEILENLNKYTRTSCGYATVHSVLDMSLEDRMESFFLSETAKYLFLVSLYLFSGSNLDNNFYQVKNQPKS